VTDHRRVVWSEGMLLAPQHFQHWTRNVHQLVRDRLRAHLPFEWGFTELEIDRDALRNGRLALTRAAGVLPDGTPFAMPGRDPLPAQRALEEHFTARDTALGVSLGLPLDHPHRRLVGPPAAPGAPGPRYSEEQLELPDGGGIAETRALAVARPNFALLFPDDAVGDHDLLPLAEVLRTGEGGFALRDNFVPPVLATGASDYLQRLLRWQLEVLVAKSTELSDKRRHRGNVADFAASDSASFWLLHTVDGLIPVLAHADGHRRMHPEQLYLALVTLAGQLCAFSPDVHPRDLPGYRHDRLGETFEALRAVLTRLLEVRPTSKAVRIDLERKDGSISVGRVEDPRLLEPPAGLYLGVRSDLDEQQLVGDVPARFKIASLDRIDFLIANALRGVPLAFVRVPPPALPVRSSFVYFQVEPRGDAWDTVKGAKNLAIFVPPDLPNVSLELLGLYE
jgi:type VI secretion system protein ImpJ